MMALVTVSAIFLRWLPHHGLPVLALVTVAVTAAAVIYFTQRSRHGASTHGISNESVDAQVPAIIWTACAAVAIGGLGIAV
jgi:MFS superfamily sulfate permease-like transporter